MAIFPKSYQILRYDDIYFNISMMLNKILIQWFSFHVTTRSRKISQTQQKNLFDNYIPLTNRLYASWEEAGSP